MHRGTYRLFVVGCLSLLLTVGTILGYKLGQNISRGEVDVDSDFQVIDVLPVIPSSSTASTTTLNQEFAISKQTKYTDCDHTSTTQDMIISESLDEALKDIIKEYKVLSKTANGAVVSKIVEGYCPNHFVITIKNNEVVVYRKITKEDKEIYLNTDIPINILRDDAIQDLKDGIEVDSVEELNKIIEEIES